MLPIGRISPTLNDNFVRPSSGHSASIRSNLGCYLLTQGLKKRIQDVHNYGIKYTVPGKEKNRVQ